MDYSTTPGGFTGNGGIFSKDKVLNPIHARIVSTSFGGYTEDNAPVDEGNNEDLVAFDFVKYLAHEMLGNEEQYVLFDNYQQIITDLGTAGFQQYQNTILPVFNTNADGFREGQPGANNISNLTRHLLQQMNKNPNLRTRFGSNVPLTVNGVYSTQFSFKRDGQEQPVMFVDDDRIIFELTINPATNQHTSSEFTTQPIEPRVYKIILQAVADDAGFENRIMYLPNETPTESNSYYNTFNN